MFNLWKPLIPAEWEGTGRLSSARADWQADQSRPGTSRLFPGSACTLLRAHHRPLVWCTDQYIVQRALGAPRDRRAEGQYFRRLLKLFPVYLFIIPGLICLPRSRAAVRSRAHRHDRVPTDSDPRDLQRSVSVWFSISSPGIRGIVSRRNSLALMVFVAGVFNACSTTFTVDLTEMHPAPRRRSSSAPAASRRS